MLDFMRERFPGRDDVPAWYQSLQAVMTDRVHDRNSDHRLSQKCQAFAKRQRMMLWIIHSQFMVGVDVSPLNNRFNFAKISLDVFNWPIVGRSSERSEAQSFYGLG